MAIQIEGRKSGLNLGRLLVVFGSLLVAGFALYYLFFAPTPGFDYIAPAPLQKTSQLSTFELDPSAVFDSAQFKALRKYNTVSGGGSFGRDNPFLASF